MNILASKVVSHACSSIRTLMRNAVLQKDDVLQFDFRGSYRFTKRGGVKFTPVEPEEVVPKEPVKNPVGFRL